MDRVFMVWLEIFSNKKFLSKSNNYRIAYYVGKHLIVYLQHIQFFWYYDMKIAYFSAYEIFWKTLSLASFDVIAASYGFLRNYALFITIFLSGSLSLIVASIFASIFKKKFPAKVYPFLRLLIIVTCDVMFIPTALVLQLAFKYSEPGKSRITEYSTFVPASEMDFGEGSRFGFMIVLIIFLGFSWMFEASSYEMRHSIEDEIHDNKIFCLVDFMKKIVDFLTTVLFLNFGSENYEMYLIILLVLHMVTSAAYVVCIPYYCYFMNYLKIISSVSLALHSLFFLVGLKIDNSSVTLILCISSPLLLVPLCKAGLDRRYQMIEKPQVSIFHKFETFEKSIRGYLKNGQLSERLIRKLNKNNNFNKSVLNKLTQAYYCNDVIGNCALALNKVFQTKKKALNFLLNFQVFKCQHIMLTACENLSQSFKLYKYFLEFAKIKKGDKKFCEHYNKLLMKLIEKNPNITEIKKVIVGVVGHLYRLEKRYTSLLMRFPNANEIKQSYGTFMINILNDITRGGKLVTRMSNTRIQRNLTRNMLRFIVDRCFLVISGNYSTLGKILFHNQNFLNFLGYTNETIKHISLNQLIPKEFIRHHDKHMLNFLENSTSNTVFKNAVLSLVNSEGYLCECIINCECIGYDKSVNFICAIDPLNFRRREMALVSLDGFIFGHSKGLCSLLGAGRRSVEGRFIQEFVDSFEMEALQNSQMKYFQIFDTCDRFNLPREVAFLLKITKVRKTGVLLLYVSEDKNEIKSWENDQEFYDVDELNNYGNKIETVITEGFDEFKESVVKKKVKIFDQDSENDDNEEKKLIESQLKNSTSRTGQHYQYLSENDFKAISKSKTVLRVTKIIMIVSIFLIISSNLGILIYITRVFNNSNSLSQLKTFGELGFKFSESSLKLRTFDLTLKLKIPPVYPVQDLKNLTQDLLKLKNELIDNYNQWNPCRYFQPINEKNFIYWSLEPRPMLRISTIAEFTEKMRQQVKNKKVEKFSLNYKSSNYEENMLFVLINSQSSVFSQILDVIEGVKRCEMEKIETIKSFDIILLIVGIGILASILLVIGVFLMSIDKDLNMVWGFLFKRMQFAVIGVRQKVIDRLAHYHDRAEYLEVDSENIRIKSPLKHNFHHSIRYLKVISILFISASLIYIINSFVFDSYICELLTFKPKLITDFIEKRIWTNNLGFYSQELLVSQTSAGYSSVYKDQNYLLGLSDGVSLYSSRLLSDFSLYRQSLIQELVSSSVLRDLNDRMQSSHNFLEYGLITGIDFFVQESNNLINTNYSQSLSAYHVMLSTLTSKSEVLLKSIVSDSQDSVTEFVSYLVAFTVIACFGVSLLYVFIYRPMLDQETEVLKGITKLLTIIPNN